MLIRSQGISPPWERELSFVPCEDRKKGTISEAERKAASLLASWSLTFPVSKSVSNEYVFCIHFFCYSKGDEDNHFEQVSLADELPSYRFCIMALYQMNRSQVLSPNLWVVSSLSGSLLSLRTAQLSFFTYITLF